LLFSHWLQLQYPSVTQLPFPHGFFRSSSES
jgi:hypothetical protein